MGLEMTELIMACEEEFGIRLDVYGAELNRMKTVGDLHTCICRVLGKQRTYRCPRVSVFLSLRRALIKELNVERGVVRPETTLLRLFPRRRRRKSWRAIELSVPHRIPALVYALPIPVMKWTALTLGIPFGLLLAYATFLNVREGSFFWLGFLVFPLWPILMTLNIGVFIGMAVRYKLPAATVGELVDKVVASSSWGIGTDGTPWDESSVWNSLQERISTLFDVDKCRISPETDFLKDLGAN